MLFAVVALEMESATASVWAINPANTTAAVP